MTQNVGTNDEAVTGSKQFFFIFLTFERDTTNYRGTLVESVKKIQQSTHPTVQYIQSYIILCTVLNVLCRAVIVLLIDIRR
jgi:hypothetical protein